MPRSRLKDIGQPQSQQLKKVRRQGENGSSKQEKAAGYEPLIFRSLLFVSYRFSSTPDLKSKSKSFQLKETLAEKRGDKGEAERRKVKQRGSISQLSPGHPSEPSGKRSTASRNDDGLHRSGPGDAISVRKKSTASPVAGSSRRHRKEALSKAESKESSVLGPSSDSQASSAQEHEPSSSPQVQHPEQRPPGSPGGETTDELKPAACLGNPNNGEPPTSLMASISTSSSSSSDLTTLTTTTETPGEADSALQQNSAEHSLPLTASQLTASLDQLKMALRMPRVQARCPSQTTSSPSSRDSKNAKCSTETLSRTTSGKQAEAVLDKQIGDRTPTADAGSLKPSMTSSSPFAPQYIRSTSSKLSSSWPPSSMTHRSRQRDRIHLSTGAPKKTRPKQPNPPPRPPPTPTPTEVKPIPKPPKGAKTVKFGDTTTYTIPPEGKQLPVPRPAQLRHSTGRLSYPKPDAQIEARMANLALLKELHPRAARRLGRLAAKNVAVQLYYAHVKADERTTEAEKNQNQATERLPGGCGGDEGAAVAPPETDAVLNTTLECNDVKPGPRPGHSTPPPKKKQDGKKKKHQQPSSSIYERPSSSSSSTKEVPRETQPQPPPPPPSVAHHKQQHPRELPDNNKRSSYREDRGLTAEEVDAVKAAFWEMMGEEARRIGEGDLLNFGFAQMLNREARRRGWQDPFVSKAEPESPLVLGGG